MFNRKLILQALFLCFLIVGSIVIIQQQRQAPYQHHKGMVFGTSYSIIYQHSSNLQTQIQRCLQDVDDALSPFNPHSVITQVNNNQPVQVNDMFVDVFEMAQSVASDTHGAFDITVAPLVNAWGFGFKHNRFPAQPFVDSLRQLVGYDKVKLTPQGIGKYKVEKGDARMMLDCSAIAKGYGCDAVARLLRKEGITNFMVEIGGEVVAQGHNEKQQAWRIGVSKPIDDSLAVHTELQTVLHMTHHAMATSANYRNFYYKDGKKYAHTIDPRTGYPVQHSLLSATVVAKSCALADAYATAFMVMGVDSARQILQRHSNLSAFLIYADKEGKLATWHSPQLGQLLKE